MMGLFKRRKPTPAPRHSQGIDSDFLEHNAGYLNAAAYLMGRDEQTYRVAADALCWESYADPSYGKTDLDGRPEASVEDMVTSARFLDTLAYPRDAERNSQDVDERWNGDVFHAARDRAAFARAATDLRHAAVMLPIYGYRDEDEPNRRAIS